MADLDLDCASSEVRQELLPARSDGGLLNGIDYLEMGSDANPDDRTRIRLYFLRPLAAGEYGLTTKPYPVRITGGVRIVGINVTDVVRGGDGLHLDITVDRSGDHSTYRLELVASSPDLDPRLNHIDFSFMATCPSDIDCLVEQPCAVRVFPQLELDYLAKDYSSFRRMLLDLLPRLNPDFVERNPSDLGISLVELLSYVGDYLSYQQDAVANEGFLFTARHRISARRHARLLDYRMHDGRNAWTFVHFNVTVPGASGGSPALTTPTLLAGTQLVTVPPGKVPARITPELLASDASLATVTVFETRKDATFDPIHNEMRIHTWGNQDCCLPQDGTEAYLYSVIDGVAVRPRLVAGDFLLIEEVRGADTGAAADAVPEHRQIVMVTAVGQTADPLYSDRLAGDSLAAWQSGRGTLPLLHAQWGQADSLQFPVCVSASPSGVGPIANVSVARGNLVLADHGLSVEEQVREFPEGVAYPTLFRLPLLYAPLTMQAPAPGSPSSAAGEACDVCAQRPRLDLGFDVHQATTDIRLTVTAGNGEVQTWRAVPDLLESTPLDYHFVAEVDDGGQAALRFGDGEYGRSIEGATAFQATYRVGNGRAGNVASDSIRHLVGNPTIAPYVNYIRNPLPARDGTDPETIEEVRVKAPRAFQAIQCRAVTEPDYASAAKTLPDVADAVASFRWTGSWYSVFLSVKPRDLRTNLLREPDGRFVLLDTFAADVLDCLGRYRLAGYDLELRAPSFVPIRLDIAICVQPDHFKADVVAAVRDSLVSSGGAHPGALFDAANLGFGQPIYLSQVYGAIHQIDGVASSQVTAFQRYWGQDAGELASGVFQVGPWEIPELANDPNFLEHGVLNLTALGGKG